ncbi:MAG: hypothetical protein K0S27_167 [Gammaproteobacteria bacterium]|jgi:SEC-C motif-containing protein|nr:hypothetical protein [Gammaproteobacteria bacterium]
MLYGDDNIDFNSGGMFMEACPCGSGKSYSECCGLFIEGKALPATPEQLMRSRYTAYTLLHIDYIGRTMRGAAAKNFNPRETENWARHIQWLGLEVLRTGMQDNNGFVEFIAKYTKKGTTEQLQELSEFHRKDGKWYYVDGKHPSANTPIHSTPKARRNDPCPCGSEKKFKKCCGQGG